MNGNFLDRFGQAIGKYEIKVDKDVIPIKFMVGDIRNFIKTLTTEENDGKRVDLQFDFMYKVISQANKDLDQEMLKLYIEVNFKKLIKSLGVVLGTDEEKSDELTTLKN